MRSPKDLHKLLDQYVAGQDEVKKALSLAVFHHCAKADLRANHGMPILLKQNLLIVGPTGCGKTYLLDVLAKNIAFPIFTINALELSKVGWAGPSLNDYLVQFYNECQDMYPKEARQFMFEHCIIFIDELDKICIPAVGQGGTDHNQGTQHSLLKILEGSVTNLDFGSGHSYRGVSVDLSNILFIFGGNFEAVRKKLNDRNNSLSIGFASEAKKDTDINTIHKELIATGMEKELAGRIANLVEVKKLTRSELRSILINKTEGILWQYQKLYAYYTGEMLTVSNYHINKILDMAEASDLGARSLHTATEEILRDRFYNIETRYEMEILESEIKKSEN